MINHRTGNCSAFGTVVALPLLMTREVRPHTRKFISVWPAAGSITNNVDTGDINAGTERSLQGAI